MKKYKSQIKWKINGKIWKKKTEKIDKEIHDLNFFFRN